MRRLALSLILAAVSAATCSLPAAAEPAPPPIVFPVVGPSSYQDTFGAPRSGGRSHAGQDIMAAKMQPLVAVVDGTVSWITIPQASYGYMLTITDDAGWSYHYVHVNNDTPGTDDGAAPLDSVFGPGIERGARVSAGQLVRYVGDSGNAEDVAPQLHFEIESPGGDVVNPFAALQAARRVAAPATDDAGPLFRRRLAGPDRVATAVAVSEEGWARGSVSTAVIADADRWAEALAASALAAHADSPLLLVRGRRLGSEVADELDRLGVEQALVVGSAGVAADLEHRGVGSTLVGVDGDPVATSAAIARRVGAADGVFVVSIESAADAISAASLAVDPVRPILFSRQSLVPQVTVDAWRALGAPPVTVVGGTAAVGANVQRFFGARRVAGVDRYATSAAAAGAALVEGRSDDLVLLASGASYADALAVAPFAGLRGAPVLLIDGLATGADRAARSWLEGLGTPEVVVVGGSGAVSHRAEQVVAAAIGS